MDEQFSSFDEGFSATITGISLFDYLQLMFMTRKNRIIEIISIDRLGIIEVDEGKVIFSKIYRGLEGIEAFYEILSWENGSFKEVKLKNRLKKNVEDPGNILLQAAEKIDELNRFKTHQTAKIGKNRVSLEEKQQFRLSLEKHFKNDTISETTKKEKECEFFDICPIFNILQSSDIKDAWMQLYCKGPKNERCARKKMIKEKRAVPLNLLPNGTFCEI